MGKNKSNFLLILYQLFLLTFWFSSLGFSQGLEELKNLCSNMSPSNKTIASQMGYDLDEICSQSSNILDSVEMAVSNAVIGRNTVSSSGTSLDIVAPAAVAGVESKTPVSSLKPFGYDLFANAPTTYAPAASMPVSGDYVLGPGDSLDILFYGKINRTFSLTINREGFVDFPELGPVGIAGLTYSEAKEMLKTRTSEQIIGTQVSITMGSLRSIQIFVLGEAYKPGAYTVSSLSTITNALMSSGGVSDIGSLRNIQLKRKGKTITTLDLYSLLLLGNTSKDIRVQAGDVIYIPTVGELVSISGQVLRPAIYELKGGETNQDLVMLAGGLGPKAFASSARLERINSEGFMSVFDLNLSDEKDKRMILRAGDHLSIDAITDYRKHVVSLAGSVRHPGTFLWYEGMRLSDIITDQDKLKPDSDFNVGLIVRELSNTADIDVLLFSPSEILDEPGSKNDIELKSRDKLVILSAYENRASAIEPYLANLKRQASSDDGLPRVVRSAGKVRFPGEYPMIAGMSLADLIDLSGGLIESAYTRSAEISRLDISNPEKAVTSIIVSSLDRADALILEPYDYVEFRTIPNFRETETISLEGEFVFPGTYVFEKGETLNSVIERAGGFTEEAFLGGSIFLRKELLEKEKEEIERLRRLLQEQIASNQLRDSTSILGTSTAQDLARKSAIEALNQIEAIGRLVIPLEDVVSYQADDILIKPNDRLLIPRFSQEVTIIGEVQRPSSYLFDSKLSQLDYIKKSGGLKKIADSSKIYIVKANGEVVSNKRNWFIFPVKRDRIEAGDTIVVPAQVDDSAIRGLPLLAQVSTIIYELALGAAAIKSFDSN